MADSNLPNTSLQKVSEQSISGMDMLAVPEKSYTRRLLAHARQQTREHPKLELIAGFIGAAIVAALAGAWGSVGLSVLGFVLTLFVLFGLYLLRSAKGLDEKLREELSATQLLLSEEKSKNEKPSIQGEIKEVLFDQAFNVELFDGERNYEDFCFTISLYVSNHRAETTIKGFKLVLSARGHSYGGEKQSAEGFYVQRRTT